MAALVLGALRLLQERRYICGYALTWGELPGTWPMDWAQRQPQQALQGGGFAAAVAGSLAPSDDTPPLPGQVFQVRAAGSGAVGPGSPAPGLWEGQRRSLLIGMAPPAALPAPLGHLPPGFSVLKACLDVLGLHPDACCAVLRCAACRSGCRSPLTLPAAWPCVPRRTASGAGPCRPS